MDDKDLLAGAIEGTLSFTKKEIVKKINEFFSRFKRKQIAFIGDQDIAIAAADARKTAEWDIVSDYVLDKEQRILCNLGISLRKFTKNEQKRNSTKRSITTNYGVKGLHISQFVENGLLTKYYNNLVEQELNKSMIIKEINIFFTNIMIYSSFIKNDDIPETKYKEILTKINANEPKTYIMSATKTARSICYKIKILLMKDLKKRYEIEEYTPKDKKIFILNRINNYL